MQKVNSQARKIVINTVTQMNRDQIASEIVSKRAEVKTNSKIINIMDL